MFSTEILITEAFKLGISLNDTQVGQLSNYASMLIEYNQHTNLVGNANADALLREHILDSLTLLPIIYRLEDIQPKAKVAWQPKLVDIGSGAGFPGLVLAIAKPELHLLVVEATAKKVVFLNSVVQALNLAPQVEVIHGRAEELAHCSPYRASFDYVTCRAMGALPLVCEISLPFLKIGGHALLQRGAKQLEMEQVLAKTLAAKLGATYSESILLDREILGKDHYVFVFKQDKASLAKFPRQWQEIKTKSLV